MNTVVFVALIAAAASIVAAVLAARSAKRARKSAESTNSLNHQIAAIDSQIESLKHAYERVVVSMVSPAKEKTRHGERFAAIELLIACRGANERMQVSAGNLHPFAAEEKLSGLNDAMQELRESYLANQHEFTIVRQFTLAGEDGRRELTKAAIRDIRLNGPVDVEATGGPRPGQIGIVRRQRRR